MITRFRVIPLHISIILLLITLATYWGIQSYPFVGLDDTDALVENYHIHNGITGESVRWVFTTTHCYSYWMPLTWFSFLVDNQLYGMDAGGYHLTNLIIHMVNSVLLFLVFFRLSGKLWASAFIAGLLALHPVHTESVVWISSRKDVLSMFFWLLTIYQYISFVRKRTIINYILLMGLYICGLLSKPVCVILPFVLLLLDFWPLYRLFPDSDDGQTHYFSKSAMQRFFLLVVEKIPLFILSFSLTITSILLVIRNKSAFTFKSLPLTTRLANSVVSYTAYLGKILMPVNLAVYYPYPESIPLWSSVGACMLLIVISVAAFRYRNRFPYIIVGWLWFLGTLVPVIGLTQTGAQAMADRFTYIPAIGIYLVFIFGVAELITRMPRGKIGAGLLTALLFSVIILTTRYQIQLWKDSITLFERTLAVTHNNYVIHNNLGVALYDAGKKEEAFSHYTKALDINPHHVVACYNLGLYFAEKDSLAHAKKYFQKAITMEHDYYQALHGLAKVYEREGKDSLAVHYYTTALLYEPDYYPAHRNLGELFFRKNKMDEAIHHLQRALSIKPTAYEVYNLLGLVYDRQKNERKAMQCYLKAIAQNPQAWEPYNNLGLLLMQQNKLAYALTNFTKAISLHPDNEKPHINRGLVYALQGKMNEARRDFLAGLRINPDCSEGYVYLGNIYDQQGMPDSAKWYHGKADALKGE